MAFRDGLKEFKSDCKKLWDIILKLNYKDVREIILKNKTKSFCILSIVIFLFLLLMILLKLNNIEHKSSGEIKYRHNMRR